MRVVPLPAGGIRLVLSGSVTFDHAEELRRAAIGMLDSEGKTELEWEQAERLDASAFQLVIALKQALEKHGRKLHVGPASRLVSDAMRMAGLGFLSHLE